MLRRYLRVLLSFALVLLAASVFTVSASADDDDDDDGGGGSTQVIDVARGDGNATFGPGVVSAFLFDVQSVDGVVSGGGTFNTTFGLGGTWTGDATCLSVTPSGTGNRAVFEIDNASNGDILVVVGDFGPAGIGDEYNFHPLPAGADATCDPAPGFDQPAIVGDIVVLNDEPAPSGGDDDDDEEDEDEDDEDDDEDD